MRMRANPKTGKLEELGCSLGMKDEYRILPEHHSSGDVVHNRTSYVDPFPFGVDVIWENDTPHDTGLTFSEGRSRAEEYNMHPMYTIHEMNEPIASIISDDDAGYAFGDKSISISPIGWSTQRNLGLRRVEDCMMGLYGKYDPKEGIVIPKCLRDYTGIIKGWTNYTAAPDSTRKKIFFICDEPDEAIAQYCVRRIGNNLPAAAIFQIMLAIKNGEYINLQDALANNGLPDARVNAILREVSTKGKRTLYAENKPYPSMNLQKYWLYWKALSRLGLSKDKLWLFRCHLLNYVLNYPSIARKRPNQLSMNIKGLLETNKRYWWIVMMVNDAFEIAKETKRPIITNPELDWISPFVKELYGPGKELETNDLRNPPVLPFTSIVEENNSSRAWQRRARVFGRILRAGRRWSPPEVKATWIQFLHAYDSGDPESFWQYIEIARTSSPATMSRFIQEAGLEAEFTPQRAFAHHLLIAMESKSSFSVREPLLQERWQLISPKSGFRMDDDGQPDRTEIFWNQLRRIWLRDHRKEYLFQTFGEKLSEGDIAEFGEELEDELKENFLVGTELGKDDVGRQTNVKIVDIDGNEDVFGGDEWVDSE